MKKRKVNFKLVLLKCLIVFNMLILSMNVYAEDTSSDDWWGKATTWYKGGSTDVGINQSVISGIADMVEVVGTAVIAIAVVVIGIKYMFGTVQGKADAKENLITLLVACFFFFGWSNIRGLLITGNATGEGGLKGSETGLIFFQEGDYKKTFSQIFTLVVTVGQFIAVAAILIMGVKYIFAGADAKAQLKEKSPSMIIGIILIFCAVTVLKFIAKIVSGTLT